MGGSDALVRPFVASRCDGDVRPMHRPVSRAMQARVKLGLIDPVVAVTARAARPPARSAESVLHLVRAGLP